MGTRSIFGDTAIIAKWLDDANSGLDRPTDDALRIMKIAEKLGEATRVYIGVTGQNPRKGVTHTNEQFWSELADVVITALCALYHFAGDEFTVRQVVKQKTDEIMVRAGLRG